MANGIAKNYERIGSQCGIMECCHILVFIISYGNETHREMLEKGVEELLNRVTSFTGPDSFLVFTLLTNLSSSMLKEHHVKMIMDNGKKLAQDLVNKTDPANSITLSHYFWTISKFDLVKEFPEELLCESLKILLNLPPSRSGSLIEVYLIYFIQHLKVTNHPVYSKLKPLIETKIQDYGNNLKKHQQATSAEKERTVFDNKRQTINVEGFISELFGTAPEREKFIDFTHIDFYIKVPTSKYVEVFGQDSLTSDQQQQQDQEVIVEVQGPTHYCFPTNQLNVRTVSRLFILQKMNFRVAYVTNQDLKHCSKSKDPNEAFRKCLKNSLSKYSANPKSSPEWIERTDTRKFVK